MPVESHDRREVDKYTLILLVLSPRGVQKLLQSGSYILQVMFFFSSKTFIVASKL